MLHVLSIKKKSVILHDIDNINTSSNFYWIDVSNPTNEELGKIIKKTKLNTHDLKCTLDKREKPRVDKKERYSLIIFRSVSKNSITPIGIIISKNFVMTIHREEIISLQNLMEEETPTDLNKIVYEIFSGLIKEFSKNLEDVEDRLDIIEEKAIKAESNMEQMFALKKTIIYLRKALSGNREVIEQIMSGAIPILKNKTLFNMLFIEISQLIDTEELIKDRLTGVLEVHLSSISNKLNEVMKSFTVIASLLLIPMLISGIYGMNFRVLPLSQHDYGFWFSLGFMGITVVLMLLFFKIRKWI
jgi:magnesium transporter